jgi:hypothetical protein
MPLCPDCGKPLSIRVKKDEETGEIILNFYCRSSDDYMFQIFTGLSDEIIRSIKDGQTISVEMDVEVADRKD